MTEGLGVLPRKINTERDQVRQFENQRDFKTNAVPRGSEEIELQVILEITNTFVRIGTLRGER